MITGEVLCALGGVILGAAIVMLAWALCCMASKGDRDDE